MLLLKYVIIKNIIITLLLSIYNILLSFPSASCTHQVSDVVFIMDSSFSMTPQNFPIERELMINLTSKLTIGEYGVRIGVIRFDKVVDDMISLKVRLWKSYLFKELTGPEDSQGFFWEDVGRC